MQEESIHRFDIYEELIEIPLDPIHCESIVQRSALHNWTIKPHQHQELLHIFYFAAGSGQVQLDMVSHQLVMPCVMIVPAQTVHSFTFGTDIDGHVVTLHGRTLDESLGATVEVIDALSKPRIISAAKSAAHKLIGDLFDQLVGEFSGISPVRQVALRAYFSLILVWITRELATEIGRRPTNSLRQDRRAAEFTALVEKHFREGATLEFYAARLSITPTQLNNISRAALGRTAKKVVHDRIYLEARRNLVYTMLTVKEIAGLVGFADPAYFARFFSRHAGMAPSEFRRLSLLGGTP
ncbi:helix-turn-helix domain-containing protein [Allopontixanthobacter sp.]|uniref:helix-turn-helix domain-containing protein n=1 Tax=Allopontixanthobacter sp. TaxID=2906452 RepID=UPI002AB817B1|nr:helix-turn-helix domain-containing protein [Allopontixanthobacter sp.]MDZ4307629.1 helix-turn-helix domain-containing protein [Allopontixanthobacter sp.]